MKPITGMLEYRVFDAHMRYDAEIEMWEIVGGRMHGQTIGSLYSEDEELLLAVVLATCAFGQGTDAQRLDIAEALRRAYGYYIKAWNPADNLPDGFEEDENEEEDEDMRVLNSILRELPGGHEWSVYKMKQRICSRCQARYNAAITPPVCPACGYHETSGK